MSALVQAEQACIQQAAFNKDSYKVVSGSIPNNEIIDEEWKTLQTWITETDIKVINFNNPYLTYDTCMRFLRARDMDIPKATIMLKDHIEFMEKEKPDKITVADVPSAMASGCWGMICETLTQNPCLLIDLKKWNPHEYSIEEYIKFVSFFEFNAPLSGKLGIHQVTIIFDMAGWAMWHAQYLSYIKSLVALSQDQFPERSKSIYIINAPFIFRATWSLISPLVDENTRKKIEFISGKPEVRMRELFNLDELPASVGGNRTVPYPVPNLPGFENVVISTV